MLTMSMVWTVANVARRLVLSRKYPAIRFSSSGNSVQRIPKKFKAFPFKYHEEFDVTIKDLTNLGLGVGRKTLADGSEWVVMVPLVLPGEVVKVRVFNNHASYSEADLVEVIAASDDRVTPRCEYFSQCGGCQYQHMNIDAQRRWKKSQVEDVLQRIGGMPDVVVNEVVGTDDLYGYRSKLTPHYDRPLHRRGKHNHRSAASSGVEASSEVDHVPIGFLRRGSRSVVDVADCIIASDNIRKALTKTRKTLLARSASSEDGGAVTAGASLLFREVDGGHVETDQRKMVAQTVGAVRYRYRAGEFFQTNPLLLPAMVTHVIAQTTAPVEAKASTVASAADGPSPAAVGASDGSGCSYAYLIDAYCGSGLFSLAAAPHFRQVFGVEVSHQAVTAATDNARLNGIANAQFLCGTSEAIFAQVAHLPPGESVVLIDPPRKGCDQVFLQQLSAFSPRRIVYVSCDPATQARDAKFIVSAGYRVADVTPFDLFPQTRHIENVMTFERAK